MAEAAIFVDLPNFYGGLLRSGIEDPRFLRDYFRNWLDFDLLARSLTQTFSGIWVFYSGERLGPSSERIDGKYLREYIDRTNSLEGVTARNVNIPGDQREPVPYKCDHCGKEGFSQSVSEKGIDASLTVHLFDTMDNWDTAFLLSGDADFVPAVASLRRRGKTVIGVGFADASPALVRECYDHINISDSFVTQDVLTYSIFRQDGIAQKWLTDAIQPDPDPVTEIAIQVSWIPERPARRIQGTSLVLSTYQITLNAIGSFDMTARRDFLLELKNRFAAQIVLDNSANPTMCTFLHISQLGLDCMRRKFSTTLSTMEGVEFDPTSEAVGMIKLLYRFDEKTHSYKPVVTESN